MISIVLAVTYKMTCVYATWDGGDDIVCAAMRVHRLFSSALFRECSIVLRDKMLLLYYRYIYICISSVRVTLL